MVVEPYKGLVHNVKNTQFGSYLKYIEASSIQEWFCSEGLFLRSRNDASSRFHCMYKDTASLTFEVFSSL